jgi:carbohydrate-selective porin OprB
MPKIANGIVLDWDITRARGENIELELRLHEGLTVRALGYLNHANMGRYEEAIEAFRSGTEARPNIEAHRKQGRLKSGAGANVDYVVNDRVRVFGRAGWNEGHNESFAYTEVNNSLSAGGDMTGRLWNRTQDRLGVAMASNGLSQPHREYLALGGLGFLLGDGTLRYGRENVVEAYYTAHLWRGVFGSAGLQWVGHPGYNRDRGPVLVGAVRVHLEI